MGARRGNRARDATHEPAVLRRLVEAIVEYTIYDCRIFPANSKMYFFTNVSGEVRTLLVPPPVDGAAADTRNLKLPRFSVSENIQFSTFLPFANNFCQTR